MEIKGWHRRFLGNTSSSIWNVDRKMGKDFIVTLDLVKYRQPMVILPNESFRVFEGRCGMLYSDIKNTRIKLVPAGIFDESVIQEAMEHHDALYFLEYGNYPKDIRGEILESARDMMLEYSLLKIRQHDILPFQIISSFYEDELKTLSTRLNVPINRVPRDY